MQELNFNIAFHGDLISWMTSIQIPQISQIQEISRGQIPQIRVPKLFFWEKRIIINETLKQKDCFIVHFCLFIICIYHYIRPLRKKDSHHCYCQHLSVIFAGHLVS